jgi:membrane associated rhomboid family serine protease
MRYQSSFALSPWVRGLIAANAVVYLLSLTVFTGPWLLETFAFQPHRAVERWWTPLTYMFLHGSFLHLAFNMLMLFFFGPAVEERLGSSRFAAYYLFCGLGGAVLSFGFMLTTPVATVYGASGAVFGVALAFAMFWPDAPIYIFPLPLPVKAKWVVVFFATLSLLAAILGARDRVAHLAHLGGFLFGFIFLRSESTIREHAREALQRPRLAHVVPPKRTGERELVEAEPPSPPTERKLDDAVDRVLDKIHESGMDSLTPEERRLLDEVSRQLRDN